jgi:hypothetical protein
MTGILSLPSNGTRNNSACLKITKSACFQALFFKKNHGMASNHPLPSHLCRALPATAIQITTISRGTSEQQSLPDP